MIVDFYSAASYTPRSFTEALLLLLAGSIATVVVALIVWLSKKRLTRSQSGNEDAEAVRRRAEASRIEAETWGLMKTNALEEMKRLTNSNNGLRLEVASMSEKFDQAIDHIVMVHEWDAGGRVGPMPSLPNGLTHRVA